MLYHIKLIEMQIENIPLWIKLPNYLFAYGYSAVVVFIVLSGYCLMLPVVHSQTGYIPGGLWSYFQRRGQRILPTYYAALILCLFLSAAILVLAKLTNYQWEVLFRDYFSPDFSSSDVILHFLLIHNLTTGDAIARINTPMWSVAVEWQIYFVFPLLLLPLWRRFGCFVMLVIAFAVSLIPHYLFNGLLDNSCPWFIGSFALGMTASEIGFSSKPNLIKLQKKLPWLLLVFIFIGFASLIKLLVKQPDEWISTSFVSMAVACFLVYCTNFYIRKDELPRPLKIMASPIGIIFGGFSYSLYLIHGPILTLLRHLLLNLHLSSLNFIILLYLFGVPICIGSAYIFSQLFERKFTLKFMTKLTK